MVDCGMVDFLTGIAGPIRAAYRDSARMCLSLDGPALPLVLPRDLLLMRRFLHLPGWRWKSGYPGCCQDGASRRNRSYCCKSCPLHVRCGQQGQQTFWCQEREKRSRSNDEPRRKGNNRGKATLSGPCPKTMETDKICTTSRQASTAFWREKKNQVLFSDETSHA